MIWIILWILCIVISVVGSLGEPSNTGLLALMMGIFLPPLGVIAGIGQLLQNIQQSNMKCIWHDFELEKSSDDSRVRRKLKLPLSGGWSDTYKCKRCGTTRWFKGSML